MTTTSNERVDGSHMPPQLPPASLSQKDQPIQPIESLLEATRLVSEAKDLMTLMYNIVCGVHQLGYDRVRLYLLSEDKRFMMAMAHKGMDVDFVGNQLTVGGDPIFEKLDGKTAVFLKKRQANKPEPYEKELAKQGVNEFVYMPLAWHSELMGLIVADNKYSKRLITADELNHLPIFTTHAAATLRNYYEREEKLSAQWKAKKYAAIQSVFTAIDSQFRLAEIFQVTCQAAHDLFAVDHIGMVRFNDDYSEGKVVSEYPIMNLGDADVPIDSIQFEKDLLARKEPLIITDVMREKGLGPIREIWQQLDIQSLLIVPILVNGRVWGSFSLDAIGRKRPFKKEEITLSKIFAAQIGLAIHNSQLLNDSEQQTQQLSSFSQTTFALTSKNDRDALLEEIVQNAVKILNGRSGGIKLYFPQHNHLKILSVYGRSKKLIGKIIPVGSGMSGLMIKEKRTAMIINNYEEWPHKINHLENESVAESMIMAAMTWQDEIIGMLYVEDALEHQFTEQDKHKLKLFADQAVIAYRNAELMRKNKGKASRLSQLTLAINEIMQHLDSMPLNHRLRLIAKYATQILNAEACGISLTLNPETLVFREGYGYQASTFLKNLQFKVKSEPASGMSGHIAFQGDLFNCFGKALNNHFAVNGTVPPQTKSGKCYSLLAIPLMRQNEHDKELIGLLRIENKKDEDGKPDPFGQFLEEDELLLRLFAEAVGVAVDSARFVSNLQVKHEHFERVIDASPTGIIVNDRDGVINYVNQKACDVLEFSADELLGMNVKSLFVHIKDAHEVDRTLMVSSENMVCGFQTLLKGKHHNHIPIEMSATRLKEGERVSGTIGYFEDLREIREARSRTDLLLSATKTLTQAPDLETGLDKFAEMMANNWGVSFCHICLFDEADGMLKLMAIQTDDVQLNKNGKQFIGKNTAVSDWPHLDIVIRQKDHHLLHQDDPKTSPILKLYAQRIEYGALHSLLVIPLKTRNRKAVGLMILGNLAQTFNREFDENHIVLARAIANQTAVLIERAWLFKETLRRKKLLEHLNDGLKQIRVVKERKTLLYQACRLAASLSSRSIGGLLKNNHYKGELVVEAIFGLDTALVSEIVKHDEGLIGEVIQTGERQSTNTYSRWHKQETIFQDQGLETLAAVPLRKSDGQIEAILFVADKQEPELIDSIDLEILERFAAQVSIALQTADLIDSEHKQQAQISLLHAISNYIQTKQDLDLIVNVVLTGITAGFGLAFNRAAIFLYDEASNRLIGKDGIGHRKQKNNQKAWDGVNREGPHDLKSYIETISKNGIDPMPLGKELKQHAFAINNKKQDWFSYVYKKQKSVRVEPPTFDRLPQLFKDVFEPTLSIILVPLIARHQTIGVLVADKKFTQIPISDGDIELLNTFANTAAVVIDNTKLLKTTQAGKRRLNSLYQASNKLVSSEPPEQVAQSIVELALEATTAVAVRMILIEGLDVKTQHIYVSAYSDEYDIQNEIRANGLSMAIMETGEPQIIPTVYHQSRKINPELYRRRVRAAAGFPVSVEENRIGVMWFYYGESHAFDDTEIQALQFYVNQAALAYENARHISTLEKMRQAAQSLASAHTLSDIKNHILTGAIQVLQADGAALWAYNEIRNQFIMADSVATFEQEDWYEFQKDQPSPGGTADTVIKCGWIGVENVMDDQSYDYLGQSTTKLLKKVGVKSFQGIRLHVDTETIGVLYVNYNRVRRFKDEDIQTAKTFAHHASLAFKKARLLERVQKEQRTAKIVANLTTLNNNSGGLSNTLKSVAEGTVEALGCDAVTIYVYEEKREKLILPPTTNGLWFLDRMDKVPYVAKTSPVAKMLEQKDIYLVDDTAKDPFFQKSRFTHDEKIKSLAVVPLKVGLEKVGIIFVNFRTAHRFTEDEISNLRLYADQTAVAIHNAQLYEREQKQIKALQVIDEAVHTISTSENLETIFNAISEQAVEITGATGVKAQFAYLVLVEDGNLFLRGAYPAKTSKKQNRAVEEINIHQAKRIGVTGRAILMRQPILVPNVEENQDYITLNANIRSNLAVPIQLDREVIGVIIVEHPEYEAFDNQDIYALEILAKHACVAIQKAHSHQKEKRQTAALTAIDKAVRKMNQSTDISEILNMIAKQAVELAGVGGSSKADSYIALVEGDFVKFEATYPAKELARLRKRIGRLPLKPKIGKKTGIIGRTILKRTPQLVSDVRDDPDYILYQTRARSELVVPILDRDEIVGVINVEHSQVNAFDEADQYALSTLAEHAAIAIRNARLYRDMESVADIGRQAATSLKLNSLLKQICQRIEESWNGRIITSIRLYDPVENVLRYEPHWHKYYSDQIDDALKREEYTQQLHQGICGLVATTKRPYFTPNVYDTDDVPNPLILIRKTRSELCVPILYGEERQLLGVLDVQSEEVNEFNLYHQRTFELLADQLAVAIRKAQEYEELEQVKGLVGSRTALAWMGMASNAWRHSIEGDAVTIRETARMLAKTLAKVELASKIKTRTNKKLQKIEDLANKILERPITPPLSSEEGAEDVIVNDFIKERIYQLWENEEFNGIDGPYLNLMKESKVVFTSSEWLRLAFDSVVDNAVDAMKSCDVKKLVVFTKVVKDKVHIGVRDSGRGIPDNVRDQLFTAEHRTHKKGHLGRGLLIVQAIVETYGGEILIEDTSSNGTTMVLSLPILTIKK